MATTIEKLIRTIRHPHVCYLINRAKKEGFEMEIVDGCDLWSTLIQFYNSNRKRGYDRMTSVRRAFRGYGCYKGWEAQPIIRN